MGFPPGIPVAIPEKLVMPGLVPGIHVYQQTRQEDVDGRDIQREDALRAFARP
jgi:hypothetical protein